MEFLTPVTFALIVILLALWLRWRKRNFSYFEDLGIPGPKPSLLFGNMVPLVHKGPLVCWKEWARKYGKIYGYYFGLRPVLYVADPKILKMIEIKDFHNFIDRPEFYGERDKKSSGFLARGFSNEQGRRWKELRSLLTPSFTTAKMKMMTPLMNSAVQTMVSKIGEKATTGEEFNVFDAYQKLTLDIIGRAAFGMSSNVQNEEGNHLLYLGRLVFSGNFQSYLVLFARSFPALTSVFKRLFQLRGMLKNRGKHPIIELLDFLGDVVRQRRAKPELRRPDLLQIMLDVEANNETLKKSDNASLTAGQDDEDEVQQSENTVPSKEIRLDSVRLDDEDVKANAVVFFLAGIMDPMDNLLELQFVSHYETTSNLLTYTTYLLSKHPEVQEKVRDEVLELVEQKGELDYGDVNKLKYLDQVISESLRMYPPVVFFVNREAQADVTYGDLYIPKGTAVQVPVHDLHYDPEHWTNPEEFMPERFAPENRSSINSMVYQPFGAGPRNCIGMRFAQMEAKIALAHVLRHFEFKLSKRYEKAPLKLKVAAVTLTPAEGVYVKAIPRSSSK